MQRLLDHVTKQAEAARLRVSLSCCFPPHFYPIATQQQQAAQAKQAAEPILSPPRSALPVQAESPDHLRKRARAELMRRLQANKISVDDAVRLLDDLGNEPTPSALPSQPLPQKSSIKLGGDAAMARRTLPVPPPANPVTAAMAARADARAAARTERLLLQQSRAEAAAAAVRGFVFLY